MSRILLVEDEPDEAKSMKMVLEKAGHTVDVAKDGKEALDRLGRADLVVLDIILPRLHGDAVLKEMKKRGIDKPVVVVTAVSREVGVEADLKKITPGLVFLQKPFSSEELVGAVASLS
ncbi:MAG: response regulator [Candidatus Diapherotrites archaeon]|nr:response regulator [Candidatus Diapherotrites archaeon]